MRRLVTFVVVFVLVFAGALGASLLKDLGAVSSVWWFLLLVVVVTVSVVFLRMRRANSDSVEGIALLNQGRFTEAVRVFEAGIARHPRSHVFHFNKGIALAAIWRTEEADAAFKKAADMKFANLGFDLERMVVPQRALTAALLGRRAESEALIEHAEALSLGRSAQLTVAKAVNAARSGELGAAKALLAAYEVKLLGGPARGLADALTAWCSSQLSGHPRAVDKVALFGEAGPDALRKVWPELTAFVEGAPEV